MFLLQDVPFWGAFFRQKMNFGVTFFVRLQKDINFRVSFQKENSLEH